MRIQKNDQVLIIKGKDRGKKGRVMRVFPKERSLLIEKMNYRTVFLRRTQQNPQGGIAKVEGRISVANVKLLCPRCSQPTRVSYSILADKTKQRTCKKCNEIF